MEIDVRQRNQRSLKRRERALRMQAERESNQQGQALLLPNGIVSDVAGTQTAADASGDSCDEDEVLLLKRSPAQQQQQALSGTGPGSVVRRHKKSSGVCAPVGDKVAANNTEATTTTPITTTLVAAAMKEDVSVDWLKMEPRLTTPEENGVEPLVDGMEAMEEEGESESPLLEEDVIDGFAILAFKTYEDLEVRAGKGKTREGK